LQQKKFIAICSLAAGALMQGHAIAQQCATPSTGAVIHDSGAQPIYVDALKGLDSTSCGENSSACKTLTQALRQATKYSVVRIIMNPGAYRESVSLPAEFGSSASRTLVIESAQPGTAIIDGADSWTGWVANSDGTFSHPWPYAWGYAAQPFLVSGGPSIGCLGLRREMVFINGIQLTQILQGPLMQPGTFFVVDGQMDANSAGDCPALSEGPHTIVIYPPRGVNVPTADVEVAVRNNLFTTADFGAQNLKLKGLVFQHDNSGANISGFAAVRIVGDNSKKQGANILLDSVTVRDNNWQGLVLHANLDITIRNSTFTANGENGVEVYRPLNFLFAGNTVTYNNWRGLQGGLTGWDANGMKVVRAHFVEVDDSSFDNNFTGGLWFDTDSENLCITGSSFNQNNTNGLYFEAIQGPVLVNQSVFYKNHGHGLQVANSTRITIRQSTSFDNGANAFFIGGSATPRDVANWQLPGTNYKLLTQDWVFDGVIFASGPDTTAGSNLIGTSLTTVTPFISTLLSNYNNWYAPNNPAPFSVPEHGKLNVSGWQVLTRQDANSSQFAVTSPALPPAPVCIGLDCRNGNGSAPQNTGRGKLRQP
jgi:hypothetical protein